MELAEKVYRYYTTNSKQLNNDKLFHLASRMAAWRGDAWAETTLHELRSYIVEPDKNLREVFKELVDRPQSGRRNAHELRQPYFNKYPSLYGAHLALFRARHLETIYGISAKSDLFAAIPESELINLEKCLLNDSDAIKILSTFAINYCYLLERVILKDDTSLPIELFYKIGDSYNTNNILDLQLMIYLYTHCIIGESNFYSRKISNNKLPIYIMMLDRLEKLIESNYDRINLDNKLEYLVCARICGYSSGLFKAVYDECEQSISSEGTFLIDKHNQNIQNERNNFVSSEHRNVLFIMSTTEYTPHSNIIR